MNPMIAINRRTLLTTLAAAWLYRGSAFAQAPGPLPWWSDRTGQSIVDFVGHVTREGGPDYVAPAELIATFDNDGTPWCEKPLPVQGAFALDRIKAMAPQHPEWKDQQPFKAVLGGNPEAFALRFGSAPVAGGLLQRNRLKSRRHVTLRAFCSGGSRPAKSGSRRSGRSNFQTVDGVHRGRVTPHQVGDCAVHQPLALEHAHAGEHGRRHFDAEVSPAAVDCGS
jgi:hypothetical protein